MKSFRFSLAVITYVAMVGCGGGGGANRTVASGGSTAAGDGGSGAGSGVGGIAGGAVGSGGADASSGTGGSSKTDAGATGTDAGQINACADFTPCGGNIVGTWRLSSECLRSVDSSYCQGFAFSMDMSGSLLTYTFAANGTFAVSFSGSIEEIVRYPIACLYSDAGAAQTCSDLEQGVRQSMQAGADAGTLTVNLTSFTCALDTDQTCVCDEKVTPSTISVAGTYTMSSGQLTMTALSESPMPDGGIGDAGTAAPMDYCVAGNTLRLRSTNSSNATISTLTR